MMKRVYSAASVATLALMMTIFLKANPVCAQTILNVGSGQTYATVQSAVNAASAVQVDTINLVTSPITENGIIVNKNIVIRGQGMNTTILQGDFVAGLAPDRVITVQAGKSLHLMNLTLQNGTAPAGVDMGGAGSAGGDGQNGGGIYNAGNLKITRCKIANNYAGKGGNGRPSSIPAIGSPVTATTGGNGGHGGGVYNTGTLYVYQSEFSGNKSGTGGNGGVAGDGYVGGSVAGSLAGGPGADGGNGGNGGYGAAIYNTGTMHFKESTFCNNSCGNGAAGSAGGTGGAGIMSPKALYPAGAGGTGGIGGNGGIGGFGSIYNNSVIDSIINCTFYGNAAGNGGNGGTGGFGGAGARGTDSIQSPVTGLAFTGGTGGQAGDGGHGGNGAAAGNGGALYCTAAASVNYMVNTTITANVAGAAAGNGGDGGSCGAIGLGGSASPTPPGISGQPGQVGTNGSGGNAAAGGVGGGFYNFTGLTLLKNNIIAGNSYTPSIATGGAPGSQIIGNSGTSGSNGTAGSSPDVIGTFSGTYNIIGKLNGSNFVNGTNNNICGTIAAPVIAQLGPLADNGGYSQTVIISASSPAKDAGNAANAPAKDQRGKPRNGTIDIGAYEYYAPSLTLSDAGNIWEGDENGKLITVTIDEDVFVNPINTAGFTVNALPAGVSKGTVTRVDGHHVTIALSGNRTTDYDADITDVEVVVNESQLAGLTSGFMDDNTGITLHAYVETATISTVGTLLESSLNGDTIQLSLDQDHFIDATLLASNFTLSKAPAGVSVASVHYVDPTHADLILGFTGTDFDTDSTHVRVIVNEIELYGVANLSSSNMITIKAVVESGIQQAQENVDFAIFPNPADQTLNLILPDVSGSVQCIITDPDGRIWMNRSLSANQGRVSLDVSDLSNGIYFVRITGGEFVRAEKLLIQH
jgi:hypothetical protein